MACQTIQVSDDVLLKSRRSSPEPAAKRARVTSLGSYRDTSETTRRSSDQEPLSLEDRHSETAAKVSLASNTAWTSKKVPSSSWHSLALPPPSGASLAVESTSAATDKNAKTTLPSSVKRARTSASSTLRAPSPSPSVCSSFSGVTTSAALSSRASLSSCRSSLRESLVGSYRKGGSIRSSLGSSRSLPRGAYSFSTSSSKAGVYSPVPSLRDDKRRRGGRTDYSRLARRDRNVQRDVNRNWDRLRSTSRSSSGSWNQERARLRGYKRSRSSSRERGRDCGVECPRCLRRCRGGGEGTPITRTLPMEYWVRTPECKAAKSKHIEFIDRVAYSREQFIEETVFTCPFTGVQRDILLERNMFPYDVPTDVEHWTLWSRTDLTESEMEAFVTKWTAENHPHVVEWECDNNEGDRSIDWYHVHVFFRLDCPDNSGARRDPFSVYTGPCGSAAITPSVPANDQNVEEQQQKKDAGATG